MLVNFQFSNTESQSDFAVVVICGNSCDIEAALGGGSLPMPYMYVSTMPSCYPLCQCTTYRKARTPTPYKEITQ